VDLVHQGAEQHGVNFTAKRVKKATLGMRLVVNSMDKNTMTQHQKALETGVFGGFLWLGTNETWKIFSPCFRDLTMVKIVLFC